MAWILSGWRYGYSTIFYSDKFSPQNFVKLKNIATVKSVKIKEFNGRWSWRPWKSQGILHGKSVGRSVTILYMFHYIEICCIENWAKFGGAQKILHIFCRHFRIFVNQYFLGKRVAIKLTYSRGVFRILSNIYDGAFFANKLHHRSFSGF